MARGCTWGGMLCMSHMPWDCMIWYKYHNISCYTFYLIVTSLCGNCANGVIYIGGYEASYVGPTFCLHYVDVAMLLYWENSRPLAILVFSNQFQCNTHKWEF